MHKVKRTLAELRNTQLVKKENKLESGMRIYFFWGRVYFNVVMTNMFLKREIKSADPITVGHTPASCSEVDPNVPLIFVRCKAEISKKTSVEFKNTQLITLGELHK